MSIGVSELSAADVAAVVGNNGGRNNNDGMFGNDWAWIIILLLFGYGGRGFGGFGGGYGAGAGCGAPCATQADVRAAVDQQTLISKIDQQTYGLADSFTALNNTLNNNFRGIDNAICTLGYQNQAGVNALSAQLAQCCCDTRYAIGEVNTGIERTGWNISKQISDCCCDVEKMNLQSRFDAQAYNCNTLQAIDKLGDRIIDYMSNEKVQALRDENQALRLAASQAKQNEFLISKLGDKCPEPAYIVQPPQQVTFPTNCCGTVNYAAGGCGGCGSF
jgi:hypothetical protein